MLVLTDGPIIRFLREWKPILPRQKIFGELLGAVELPPGVTPEEAIEVVAKSEWAKNLAGGICSKLVGLTPGTPEYERCVYNVSHKVAARLLGFEWPTALMR